MLEKSAQERTDPRSVAPVPRGGGLRKGAVPFAGGGERYDGFCRGGIAEFPDLREGVVGPLEGKGRRTVTRRTLAGPMDFAGETLGLTASNADTSAISMLSELISAPMVEVEASSELLARGSEERRGRFSVRVVGESSLTDRRLLAVERVLIRREPGVLIVPFVLTGVLSPPGLFCGVVRIIFGSNILDEVETFDWTRDRRGSGLMGLSTLLFDDSCPEDSSSTASTSEFRRLRDNVICFGGTMDTLGLYFGSEVARLSRGLRTVIVGGF